jgi:oxalate decarboxylase
LGGRQGVLLPTGDSRYSAKRRGARIILLSHEGMTVGKIAERVGVDSHYIENTGTTDLVFLEMFRSPQYEDISLAKWMAHTPHQLIEQHLHVGWAMIDAIPNDETVIVLA